jgi:isopenicillin N synthase-like dioxygenase
LLNSEDRFSIASFISPPDDKLIAPIAELVPESQPIRYKSRTYSQYRTEVMTIPYMAKTLVTDA